MDHTHPPIWLRPRKQTPVVSRKEMFFLLLFLVRSCSGVSVTRAWWRALKSLIKPLAMDRVRHVAEDGGMFQFASLQGWMMGKRGTRYRGGGIYSPGGVRTENIGPKLSYFGCVVCVSVYVCEFVFVHVQMGRCLLIV